MINATALYYKYSKVLYTNSRVMYIGKLKNPTHTSRENKKKDATNNRKFKIQRCSSKWTEERE